MWKLALGLSILLASGCASLIHGGGSQKVGVSSTPSGATVLVDDVESGVTPVTLNLKRGKSHTMVFRLDGYEEASATTSKKVSGWVWGNILLGGIIGLLIDFGSGGVYNIVPENVDVTLRPLPVPST